MGDILGYARVSTHDQHPDAQRDRLMEAGALRVFTDIISGSASTARPWIVPRSNRKTARHWQGNGLQNRKSGAVTSKPRAFGSLE